MTYSLTEYGEWLSAQAKVRQEASLVHMRKCARLGELDRTMPRSEEARQLRAEISAYYEGVKGGAT